MGLSQAQCRTSAITSAKLGVGPSTPTEALPSTNEVANARAAAQPIMALHLRVHADRARPRIKSETLRVLAQAKSLRNCAVSEEKRPPTYHAITTSLALPPLPVQGTWSPCLVGQVSKTGESVNDDFQPLVVENTSDTQV